ncbi:hypothetical protein [Microbacterium sp. CIAB417]|uniref:hypothetical protein n=1 Tax=Microbacterium sp. CIAB417 TaxID=2860287 RepID=UPI001FABD977|nr:hypothetical protein [Microbacterium sp. CIAB417]
MRTLDSSGVFMAVTVGFEPAMDDISGWTWGQIPRHSAGSKLSRQPRQEGELSAAFPVSYPPHHAPNEVVWIHGALEGQITRILGTGAG